jgi:hypothetical protein
VLLRVSACVTLKSRVDATVVAFAVATTCDRITAIGRAVGVVPHAQMSPSPW